MKTSELDYHLPNELIAQEPVEPRDSSKLLVLDRQTGSIEHRRFTDLGGYLKNGDLLVVNDTKVLPARLKGHKKDTGAQIELLLLTEIAASRGHPFEKGMSPRLIGARNDYAFKIWEVLVKPAKRLQLNSVITFDPDLSAEVIEELEDGRRLVKFHTDEPLLNMLQKVGQVPLPPYIVKPLLHPERYQTIYARKQESAAAPTAGLHFTPRLIEKLKKEQGIKFAHLTLRIGLDTFQPIREEDVEKHRIHSEYYEVSEEAAGLLNKAREQNERIIAVGTTSARVLETLEILPPTSRGQDDKSSRYTETTGYTDLFIYPGYEFKAVDMMLTNFHLPKSTLLAMVGAFASLEKIKKAYSEAIQHKYRFFSFGDAMLIL